MHSDLEEDDLILAGLEILESRKLSSRSTFCYSCESEMKVGPLLVCAECLEEECETFEDLTYQD